METNKLIIPLVMLSSGAVSFSYMKKHIIPMLISLEMMMLATLNLIASNSQEPSKPLTMIILITIMACEGATGLSCMVATTKTKGNELTSSLML